MKKLFIFLLLLSPVIASAWEAPVLDAQRGALIYEGDEYVYSHETAAWMYSDIETLEPVKLQYWYNPGHDYITVVYLMSSGGTNGRSPALLGYALVEVKTFWLDTDCDKKPDAPIDFDAQVRIPACYLVSKIRL